MKIKSPIIKTAAILTLAAATLFFLPKKSSGEDSFWVHNPNVPPSLTAREYGHSIYYRELNFKDELDKIDDALAILGGAYLLNEMNQRTQRIDTSQWEFNTYFDVGNPINSFKKGSKLETEIEKAQGYKPEGFLLGAELYKKTGDKWMGIKYTTDKTDENGFVIKNDKEKYKLCVDEEKVKLILDSKKDKSKRITFSYDYSGELFLFTFRKKF